MKRTLGTCYYPEHWPREMWEEDARRMVEAGLTWVRIGEFAWSRMLITKGALHAKATPIFKLSTTISIAPSARAVGG